MKKTLAVEKCAIYQYLAGLPDKPPAVAGGLGS
jgi:hypothetical protein